MAPKAKAAPGSGGSQGSKEKTPPPPTDAADKKRKSADVDVTKNDQANFSTQMNAAANKGTLNPDQLAMWTKYKKMGRYDEDKKELIAQWKLDKSCKWIQHFRKSQEKSSTVENDSLSGWGTRLFLKTLKNICS